MYIFISILIFIVCILLILIVLIQNSKGGGLTSSFSGSNQVLGVKKTTDFLEKSTWTLAIVLLFLTLSSIFVIPKDSNVRSNETNNLEILQDKGMKPVNYQPQKTEEGEQLPPELPAE
jgi:preprotein translocase subunit SecG